MPACPEGALLRAGPLLQRSMLGDLPDVEPDADECGDGSEILMRSGASVRPFPGLAKSSDSEADRAAAPGALDMVPCRQSVHCVTHKACQLCREERWA